MSDEAPQEETPKIEYGLSDFIEEVTTVIWEKQETAKREAGRHNTPMAGLTNLRVDRLNALSFYLRKIENFQKGKAPPKEVADPSALAIERTAIAALFSDDSAVHLALALKRRDFRDPVHGMMMETAVELCRMGKTVNLERLRTFLPVDAHEIIDAFVLKQPEEEQPPAAPEPEIMEEPAAEPAPKVEPEIQTPPSEPTPTGRGDDDDGWDD